MSGIESPGDSKKPLNRWYLIVPSLFILGLLYLFGMPDDRRALPKALGELRLTDQLTGDAAKNLINRLHGKGVSPEGNEVGFYRGDRGDATLYASVYPSGANAAQIELKMADRIAADNPVFKDYRKITSGNRIVHRCSGMGQEHFFFSVGPDLYWLAADSPVAEAALGEVLKYATR